MKSFDLIVLAPDKVLYDGRCESLTFPTEDGTYGILANHAPLAASVVPGELSFRTDKKDTVWAAVSSGVVCMRDNRCTVLVSSAEDASEIDEARAMRDVESSEMHIRSRKTTMEYELAKYGLVRAMTRLNVRKRRYRKK